jgi:GT2 family glycosyltransferase
VTARIGVSVVLWRPRLDLVARTLDALAVQTLAPCAVRVHVNEATVAPDLPVEVTTSPDNLGFCGGHNRNAAALFAAGADAVLVLNPDLVLDPGALAAFAAAYDATGGRALVGPVLELADPETLAGQGILDTTGIRWTVSGRHLDALQGAPLSAAPTAPANVAGISGACLLVGRAAYDTLVAAGGELFDECFVAYREDAELAWRAALLGVPSLLWPDARGRHARTLRGTSRDAGAHVNRLGVQNRFLIAFKYGRRRPGLLPLALARDAVVVAAVLLRERSSLPGLRRAWSLRRTERAKGRAVLAASTGSTAVRRPPPEL